MNIEMISTAFDGKKTYFAGGAYIVRDELAETFIKSGWAKALLVEQKKNKTLLQNKKLKIRFED